MELVILLLKKLILDLVGVDDRVDVVLSVPVKLLSYNCEKP